MLIQKSSEKKQITHSFDYRHDVSDSDQSADQLRSAVSQQIKEL